MRTFSLQSFLQIQQYPGNHSVLMYQNIKKKQFRTVDYGVATIGRGDFFEI